MKVKVKDTQDLSEGRINKRMSEKISGYILAENIETNEIIAYYSLVQASKETDINKGSISSAINNKIPSAGGYRWYRVNEVEQVNGVIEVNQQEFNVLKQEKVDKLIYGTDKKRKSRKPRKPEVNE